LFSNGSTPMSLYANRARSRRARLRTLVFALPFLLLSFPLLRHPYASAVGNPGDLDPALVLREVVESAEVRSRMYNDAFVLMEYFGYLRRDAEEGGFNAWLAYLNAHPGDYRTMVRGFINSVEYRKRFGDPGPPQPGQAQE
jgi:hypothetical protein